MLTALIFSMRPKQWTKNALLFAGYLFTIQHGHSIAELVRVCAAFAIFCGISGATYLINDVIDIRRDAEHPTKRKRPIAGGRLPVTVAVGAASVVVSAALTGSFQLGPLFFYSAVAYLALSLSYSTILKQLVIVDVLCIAAGFVVRAVAGSFVIDIEGDSLQGRVSISQWLLLCSTLLALFLGLAKRRSELLTLEDGHKHRATLGQYTAPMLDQMLNVSASATLMAYCLYTFTGSTGTNHPAMMVTIPFVVYGLFRYMYLIQSRNAGGSPELVLLEDKPMLLNMLLYVIAAALALKF